MPSPTVLERLTAALADRYSIEREIGEGGMATVFLATDVRHERRVAIKVLHPELSAMLGPDRFLSEIKLTASLQHPHILPLFDSGAADGLLYYVMPFVEGETLRRRLDRERQLPVADAVKLATEIADALHYAHERGIVHRDIKPENVLLQSGRAVVADFGIALAVQQAGGTRMTQTGMSLGTPQYMAPEQAMGERNVDARADIYALGAMTYEMLAGEPPFTGPTAQAIVAKVMTERARPLRAVRDTVPEYVESGVATALEKLPADRFSSAALFAASFDAANAANTVRRSGADVAARSPASTRRGLRAALFAAVALVAGVAIGAFAINRVRGPVSSSIDLAARYAITPPDSVRLRLICCGQMFSISPDGRWLVFQGNANRSPASKKDSPTRDSLTADSLAAPLQAGSVYVPAAAETYSLYLRDLTELDARPLAKTDGATAMFFSPKNDEIAFAANQQLWRLPLAGGDPQLIAAIPDGFVAGGTWDDDGQITLAVSNRMLRVPASGGTFTALFAPDSTGLQFGGPQMFVRERVILYTIGGFVGTPRIVWRSLESGASHIVAEGATPTYLPAQRALLLVRSDGTLLRYPFDLEKGDTTGTGVRIASNVTRRSPIVIHAEYAVSNSGTLVLATRRDTRSMGGLTFVDLARGVTTSRLLPELTLFGQLLFSPDNSRLLADGGKPLGEVVPYIIDLERKSSTRLQLQGAWGSIAFTRGGDSILYSPNPSDLVVQSIYGSSAPTRVLRVRDWKIGSGHLSVWGPWYAFEGIGSGNEQQRIVVAHRDSADRARALDDSKFTERDPIISPDGRWIAFTSTENGRDDVFLSEFPTSRGRYPVSTAGGASATWSTDSRTIYFTQANQVMAASVSPGQPPKLGAPRAIYRRTPWSSSDVSPNGTLLAFGDRVREGEPASLVVQLHAIVAK